MLTGHAAVFAVKSAMADGPCNVLLTSISLPVDTLCPFCKIMEKSRRKIKFLYDLTVRYAHLSQLKAVSDKLERIFKAFVIRLFIFKFVCHSRPFFLSSIKKTVFCSVPSSAPEGYTITSLGRASISRLSLSETAVTSS